MKKILLLLTATILIACKKDKTEAIPAYLKIDAITLNEGSSTDNITDAWVYINEQLQGVYELPAEFPVLESERKHIRIKAGIKINGIASSRIAYPFYKSFIDSATFTPSKTTTIHPTVSYTDSAKFFVEDFEGVGLDISNSTNSDTVLIKLTDSLGNKYAAGILNDSLITFEIATKELFNLPQAGAPVFLELDYKNTTSFLVGVYVNYPESVVQKDLLWVNPKQDWNKIYVNLTSIISQGINASSFKVFIGMRRDFSESQNEIYFDNLKVVY